MLLASMKKPALFSADILWRHGEELGDEDYAVFTISRFRKRDTMDMSIEELLYLKAVVDDAVGRAGIAVPA